MSVAVTDSKSSPLGKFRFQYSLGDLYLLLALTIIGLALFVPRMTHLPLRQSDHDLASALLVAALTWVGGAMGLWRAHVRRTPPTGAQRIFALLMYVGLAWFCIILFIAAPLEGALLLFVPSLIGTIWAWIRIKREGYEDPERFACYLRCMAAVWAPLLVAGALMPNYVCRRLAYNEGASIGACKAYAEAQYIYHRTDWDGNGVLEYAQSIAGDFSLFKRYTGKECIPLVDLAFARASDPAFAVPRAGYLFRILTRQGPNAPGSAKSYLTPGPDGKSLNMTEGYALIAWPATWDQTGRSTFVLNNTGTVYLKDLGPNTANLAALIVEYNPDQTWVVAE